MRLISTFAVLALLVAAPLAAAGGLDIGVRYAEDEDARCSSSGTGYDEGNSTWNDRWHSYWYRYGYSEYESCHDEITYARAYAAHDDEMLVDASARGASHESDSRSYHASGSGYWYSDGEANGSKYSHNDWSRSRWGSHVEGWSRTVDVRTAAGDARVQRACSTWHADSSHDYGHGGSSRYNDSTSSYEYAYRHDQGEAYDGCRDSASAGNATVARQDYCASEHESSSSGYRYSQDGKWYESGQTTARSEYSCFDGVTAATPEGGARAGSVGDCEHEAYQYDESGAYGDSHYEHQASECRSGYAVDGPFGFTAFLGNEYEQWSFCEGHENATCESNGRQQWGTAVQWEESPLGPFELVYWRDLP